MGAAAVKAVSFHYPPLHSNNYPLLNRLLAFIHALLLRIVGPPGWRKKAKATERLLRGSGQFPGHFLGSVRSGLVKGHREKVKESSSIYEVTAFHAAPPLSRQKMLPA